MSRYRPLRRFLRRRGYSRRSRRRIIRKLRRSHSQNRRF